MLSGRSRLSITPLFSISIYATRSRQRAQLLESPTNITHGSLIFIGVLRIYNVLYFLLLEDLSIFLIVFSGLLSAKWAVVHNTIEPALEVLCSSKLNFQFLEVNFQNERTVSINCEFPYKIDISYCVQDEKWKNIISFQEEVIYLD